MATASIRKAIPAVTLAIMALALVIAMVATSLVAAGHAPSDAFGSVSVSVAPDERSAPETGHATAACHGCVDHAGAVLPASSLQVLARITDANLVALDDTSPPTAASVPPVEPPRG